jgi:hypothetical protein
MSFELKTVALQGDTPGATTSFSYYVIGPENAPEKVHLQAALHADEQPGITYCRACSAPTNSACCAPASP